MDLSFLPAVNATLNAISTALLLVGFRLIKQGRIEAHRRVMLSAFGVSSLFLVLYVSHKVWRDFENTPYQAEGAIKTFYLVMLASHILLAMCVPVLAIALIRLGWKRRDAAHRRLARWAWPIWMYVSLTGVLIYVMLYHLNPGIT